MENKLSSELKVQFAISRLSVLHDLVNMIDNQYVLTILGKEAYVSLRMIETAITYTSKKKER